MTAVTIRGTFTKDTRPGNGLEEIADDLLAHRDRTHYVVGLVKFAGGNIAEDGSLTPAVKFLAIEPLEEGSSPHELAKKILDDARKTRGLGVAEESISAASQLEGQQSFDFEGPDDGEPRRVGEVRMGPDGEHEVPPPSAEELEAERREAEESGVPAAEFSGGDDQ